VRTLNQHAYLVIRNVAIGKNRNVISYPINQCYE
jgi:hypothetical protein